MNPDPKHITDLRKFALSLPEAEEGVVCSNLSFKSGKKNFFFLGVKDDTWDIRLKLGDSLPEAEALAARDSRFEPGKGGWTYAEFALDEAPPDGLLEKWIEESFRLLVPKKISAQLDA
ncbi:MAG: MmcQ/YjbR family DNA-binding protein [Verrucomicrobiales bacterium]|nr:MmcQ/YjbR family DNA-binding protein [Verrucomicrobiales bacterium]